MKKIIVFYLILFTGTRINAECLLMDSLKFDQPESFRCTLFDNQQISQANKTTIDMLDVRDKDGLNMLHHAILIGDQRAISAIFDRLENLFNDDLEKIFEFLDRRDPTGLGPLALSEYNGNRRVVQLVLYRAKEVLYERKDLFLKFLNAADYDHQWRALLDAAYDGQSDSLRLMVKTAEEVFGKKSDYFKQFINARDRAGHNAAEVARHAVDRYFLQQHGARVRKGNMLDQDAAALLGKKLVDAANAHDLKQFKDVLGKAKEKFTGNENELFDFLTTADDAGWNVMIHAAAENQIQFLQEIFTFIDETFAPDHLQVKTLLLSNTDFEGRTPLHMAISRKHFDIALFIINRLQTFSGSTALLFAALNTPDEINGFTPLINAFFLNGEYDKQAYAFIEKFIEIVRSLVGRNSRAFHLFINAVDYNGNTSLSYARGKRVKNLLFANGAVKQSHKPVMGRIQVQ